MKKIILLSLLITNIAYSQMTFGKQWWDFVLYDRTIETVLNNVADADSSSVVWAKTSNNWYNKIYNNTGALLYHFDTSGNLGLKTSGYLNFNTGTLGTSGYGFHDNAGTIQYKNSGGSWADIGTTLTQEQVEDYVGTLIGDGTGTHTRITITYQDATGDMDFVVDDMNDDVPDAGDFGNATDLDANGALNTGSVDANELVSTAVTPGSYTNTDLTVDADGRITAASNGSGGAAEIQMTFKAMTAKLPASNPAVIDGGENNFKLLFNADADESCSWGGILDDDYSGTLYCDIYWSMASATADEVVWDVLLWAVTPSDAAEINTESYDTANSSTATVPGTAGYMIKTTITLSNDDSIAAGDMFRIKINRDADNVADDALADAEIYFIVVRN